MTTTSADGPRLSQKQVVVLRVAVGKLQLEPHLSERMDLSYRVDNHGHLWTSVFGRPNTFCSLADRGLIRWIQDSRTSFRGWLRLTDEGWALARERGWARPVEADAEAQGVAS